MTTKHFSNLVALSALIGDFYVVVQMLVSTTQSWLLQYNQACNHSGFFLLHNSSTATAIHTYWTFVIDDFSAVAEDLTNIMYILKQYFLLEVITRGRSNLVPDQTSLRACRSGGQGLRLLMDCYWLGGTWRYSCSRSALIFLSSEEQAQWESWTKGSCRVIFSNFQKFFFLCSTDLSWVKEMESNRYLFRRLLSRYAWHFSSLSRVCMC